MKIDPTCDVRNDCNATQSPVRLHHVTMPTERLLQVIERQLGDLVPQADRYADTWLGQMRKRITTRRGM